MTTESRLRCQVVESTQALIPGEPASIVLAVTNASAVIDAIRVNVEGPPEIHWNVEPELLALFPDDSGQVVIHLDPQLGLDAGDLDINVVVVATSDPDAPEALPFRFTVAPVAGIALTSSPTKLVKHARGVFKLDCTNDGNTPLDIDFGAQESTHALRFTYAPPTMRLRPGEHALVSVGVRTKRKLLGNEIAYPIDLIATAPETQANQQVTFTRRPLIPRGARTLLVLGAIVAAWAIIVVVALTHALGASPLSKVVPASFYATSHSSGTAPAGAVPKSGIAIGIGGTLTGSVDAASTGNGVGRVTVQAFNINGSHVSLVASAATTSAGVWSIPGLAPGTYALDVSAPGYQTTWYPNTTSIATAKLIHVQSLSTIGNLRLVAHGLPGAISGTVNSGEDPSPPITVTVLPETGSNTPSGAKPLATTTVNAQGDYSLANLPTPGTYDLSFSSAGFGVGQAVDTLTGGQHFVANTVVLTASPGTITGTVTAAGQPLGGVTVTATGSGTKVTTATPTSGPVGTYLLANLPTPGTYAITFSAPGYGSTSVAEQLGPGQSLSNINVALTGGAGDVSGTVTSSSGGPLGGVTVTANTESSAVTTTTATTGAEAGSYLLANLPTPGTYAITFSAPGYQSQTVDVTLSTNATASGINATLAPATGTVEGLVETASDQGLAGASITLSNGSTTITTVTASTPAGSYELPEVAPGTYAITATLNGYQSNTVEVQAVAGKTVTAPNLVLTSSGQAS
ncbi:carboxypeptidase regulatory-like domain-containing protein [Ferrimicrobium sp.]|uniref:carboxypeptidase regulatory-like domain-containing protein n=1 Tax=Ferrimicrobium sp. TaxID=2926050 RepID=UPI002612FBB5|nr:carboxypeptidase regulatory-like domain-containing protein [Ferrimicrobium sp.]